MIWFWFPIAVVCAVAGAFFAWKAISESLDKIFGACDEGPRDYGMAARERSNRPGPFLNSPGSGRAPHESFRHFHKRVRREQLIRDLSIFHRDDIR